MLQKWILVLTSLITVQGLWTPQIPLMSPASEPRLLVKDSLSLGLDSVKLYTGYFDVSEDKHLFYWFYESRNKPETDPLVVWLNGGPGCSSTTGLLLEIGPSYINASLQPEHNPHSWNSNASVIFLDQPAGVGYSYTDGEKVDSTALAAKDFYVFLELFFEHFPQFRSNSLHISGESYGGHYIPSFTAEILDHPERTFNVSSVLIGNGFTDAILQYEALIPMGCGQGGYPAILSEAQCLKLRSEVYPKCVSLLRKCNEFQDPKYCLPAFNYCEPNMFEPFYTTGLNPFDIRMNCVELEDCYPQESYIDKYLNLDSVRSAVGVLDAIDHFQGCSDVVDDQFSLRGDKVFPHQQFVAKLLENDIPVLIFAGDKDYRCNWIGNLAWTLQLDYSGHAEFSQAPLVPWVTSQGTVAGEVKNHGIFTFLRFHDSGHLAPYDKPVEALDLLNTWVQGNYGLNK